MNLENDGPKAPKVNRGIGGHQAATGRSVEWLTPRWILERLGEFDLDPCSPVVRPWPTAKVHYTMHDNGLIKEWHGRVWLNPPYQREEVPRWMGRMQVHRVGTSLIFARTETDAWHDSIFPHATALFFFKRRVRFCRPDGTPGAFQGGAPSVLVSYGIADALILAAAGFSGHFVMLQPVA